MPSVEYWSSDQGDETVSNTVEICEERMTVMSVNVVVPNAALARYIRSGTDVAVGKSAKVRGHWRDVS